MPLFEQRLAIVARGLRAFLNLEAGVTRGAAPEPPQADQSRELEQARQELANKDRELASKDQELVRLRARMVRSGTGAEAGESGPKKWSGSSVTGGAAAPGL